MKGVEESKDGGWEGFLAALTSGVSISMCPIFLNHVPLCLGLSHTGFRGPVETPRCCCFLLREQGGRVRGGPHFSPSWKQQEEWTAQQSQPQVAARNTPHPTGPKPQKGLSGLVALASPPPPAALQMTLFVCLQRQPGRRTRS